MGDRMQMLYCNVLVQIIHLKKKWFVCVKLALFESHHHRGQDFDFDWQTHSVNDKYHSGVGVKLIIDRCLGNSQF